MFPMEWIDAFDPRLAIRGLGWLEENRRSRSFRRLPDRAADALPLGVQHLSRCPAGVYLSFLTDSRRIAVKATVNNPEQMCHMPRAGSHGVELYVRDGFRWHPAAVAYPDEGSTLLESELVSALSSDLREYRLYLPLYRELLTLALGIDRDAKIRPRPPAAGEKPILFYGSSITQGACAGTAGAESTAMLGRMLDVETVNFGFSGGARGEPAIARLIAELDVELFVLDFMPNCPSGEFLAERLPVFVDILRESRATVPIVLVTQPNYNGALLDREIYLRIQNKRDAMLHFYAARRAAGDQRLHLIDGFGLSPAGLSGQYVDGVHPTSRGFAVIAERFAPQLTPIRCAMRQWS